MLQDSRLHQRIGPERQKTIVREQTTIAMFRGRVFLRTIVRRPRKTVRFNRRTTAR